jgi:hypothetical protein
MRHYIQAKRQVQTHIIIHKSLVLLSDKLSKLVVLCSLDTTAICHLIL